MCWEPFGDSQGEDCNNNCCPPSLGLGFTSENNTFMHVRTRMLAYMHCPCHNKPLFRCEQHAKSQDDYITSPYIKHQLNLLQLPHEHLRAQHGELKNWSWLTLTLPWQPNYKTKKKWLSTSWAYVNSTYCYGLGHLFSKSSCKRLIWSSIAWYFAWSFSFATSSLTITFTDAAAGERIGCWKESTLQHKHEACKKNMHT